MEWNTKVPTYRAIPIGGGPGETAFTQLFVPTADTVRLTFLLDTLARKSRHIMLVGSGSGKTSIINQYLQSLDKDVDGFLTTSINMSYFTDSKRLASCRPDFLFFFFSDSFSFVLALLCSSTTTRNFSIVSP